MTDDSKKPNAEPELDKRQLLKLAIELGPLIAFIAAYIATGDLLRVATPVLMATTLVSLAASKFLLGQVATMLKVTAVFVCVLGTLSFWLNDPTFIKMKPTLLYVLFAGALVGGLQHGKLFLKQVLGEAMSYTDEGWRILTIRWAVFFAVLAVTNEFVWRGADWYWADVPHIEGESHPAESVWLAFKFGLLPITMAFAISQFVMMKRYEIETK